MEIAVTLVAIFLALFAALRPFRIGRIPIDIATGALLILAVLFAFRLIDLETIRRGVIGDDRMRPWEIVVIFFTVAYVSISVDVTGILDFIAYKIVRRAGAAGVRLFVFFYLFACLLTAFTSNDIVILTLTPIIFYLGNHARLNVLPLLFAEFFGANTLSMLLYIGNPTNIIVGNALNIGFFEFTKVMWFPTLVAGVANLAFLYLFFRKSLTRKIEIRADSQFRVRNWIDALVSVALLLAMLATLTVSQTLGVPIWAITTAFAAVFVVEDLLFGFYYSIRHKMLLDSDLEKSKEEIFDLYGIPPHRHEFLITLKRMPWKILPFILLFFILMAELNKLGAVDQLALTVSRMSLSPGSSVAVNGTLGFLLSNVINNQPMTILLGNVFVNDHLRMSPAAFSGGAYAVIIASNLGANLTLIGSLAGLMWHKILKTKGVEIRYVDFLRVGLTITPVVFALTLCALYVVLR